MVTNRLLFSLCLSYFLVSKLKDCTVYVSEAEVAGVFVDSKSQNKNSKFGFTQLVIKNAQHVRWVVECFWKAGGKK